MYKIKNIKPKKFLNIRFYHEFSFDIKTIHKGYKEGTLTPSQVVKISYDRITQDKESWIFQVPRPHVLSEANYQDEQLKNTKSIPDLLEKYPLFGIPYGVKDNIDVAGFPTTAGCPAYSRTPWESSPVVNQVEKCGAILMGKQNMDQFAAGLVGVRSPYGIPKNPFNSAYCPGGSSSGSGVATSNHQVSFSFGTDTAGSGRVPACFNNIVGLKPTKNILSNRGMVPACRTLDCISIFALTADDAYNVFTLCNEFDPLDEYSRIYRQSPFHSADQPLRFGVPGGDSLKFFGNTLGMRESYDDALKLLSKLTGATIVPIDFSPFTEVATVLYNGPWVGERLSALTEFYESRKEDIHPVTRGILEGGKKYSSVDTFLGLKKMEQLRRKAYTVWDEANIDALIVPTASITPTIEEVMQVPVGLNTVLGLYVNFVNLLDLCAMAVPNTFLPTGMPTGISIIGRAFDDHFVYQVGRLFQSARNLELGAKDFKLPPESQNVKELTLLHNYVDLVVCGAHMKGLPLNKQLTEIGGKMVKEVKTTPNYSLFDISSPEIKRPGMIRNIKGGSAIDVEVWRIPKEKAGDFLRNVKPPLTLGTITLQDGSSVKGFLCESFASEKAVDISTFGGWRNYISQK